MNAYYEHSSVNYVEIADTLDVPPHFHESIEFAYILDGTVHACVAGVECNLRKGDFIIAFPEMVHSYDNESDIRAILALITPGKLPQINEFIHTKQPISPVPHHVFPEAAALFQLLANNQHLYNRHIIRSMLTTILELLFSGMEFKEVTEASHVAMQEIIRYCERNYKTDISMDQVAKSLHISKAYISYLFSNKFHMPFRSYINALRLGDSIYMLENTKKSMTDIAIDSGFETIRTFNRVFKNVHGISPLEYRKEKVSLRKESEEK